MSKDPKSKGDASPPSRADGDLCHFPSIQTELSRWEQLSLSRTTEVTKVLDALSKRFSEISIPDVVFQGDIAQLRLAADYYLKERFELRPEEFFRRPDSVPSITACMPFSLTQGGVFDISFESCFQPRDPALLKEFGQFPSRRTSYARVWRHPEGESLGTVIAVHGWMLGSNKLSAMTMVPGYFFNLGLDVLVYELPYHGRRAFTSGPSRIAFPSADISRTNEGFAQAICELRSIVAWLKKTNEQPIGVVGMSLGAYTAALLASLDPFDFLICAAPLVSMSDFAFNYLKTCNTEECKLVRNHFSIDEFRQIYSLHCPLSYQPKVSADSRLILASEGDAIVPMSQPSALWEHWQRSPIEWLPGGHLGQLVQKPTLELVHNFLLQKGLAHEKPLEIRRIKNS